MHAFAAVHELSSLQPHRAGRSRSVGLALLLVGALTASAALAPAAFSAPAGSTTLIDRPAGDGPLPFDGLRYSILQSRQSLSAGGNLAVFESEGDALHAGEGNKSERYVYVRDRLAGTTTNVCRSTEGVLGNRGCNEAGISPNGRYVVFRSMSTNLTGSGSTALGLIYRRDLQTGTTELMSRQNGANGNPVSSGYIPSGSAVADTGTVVFATTASLNASDTNNQADVYARVGSETRLVSRIAGGAAGNAGSEAPTISGDGNVVAFESNATNFSGTDANGKRDIYVSPISALATPVISSRKTSAAEAGNGESTGPSLSQTGRYLAFSTTATNLFSTPITTDANGVSDVVLRDRTGNANIVASIGPGNVQADGDGVYGAAVSADGGTVAFTGEVPAFGAPGEESTSFVRDITGGTTTIASRSSGANGTVRGGSVGGVTNGGAVVLFGGNDAASGLDESQVFARVTATSETKLVSIPSGPPPSGPFGADAYLAGKGGVSADGGLVAFTTASGGVAGRPFDGYRHAVLRDMRTGLNRVLDLTPSGAPGAGNADEAQVSADGSTAAFYSYADDLHSDAGGNSAHLFVVDLATGAVTVADRATDGTVVGKLGEPEIALSDDGKVIGFITDAGIDPADTNNEPDLYVRDLRTGVTRLASRRDGAGTQAASGGIWGIALSGDGTRAGFTSSDPNLVAGDGNGKVDAFVRVLGSEQTRLVSRADGAGGAPGNNHAVLQDLSADGTKAAFESQATNLGDGDTSSFRDIHVRDLSAGSTAWVSQPAAGGQSTDDSYGGSMSADGTRVAFASRASGVILPDANGDDTDAFVRDLPTGNLLRVGLSAAGTQPSGDSGIPALSANGRCAVFESSATDVVSGGYASPDYRHLYMRAIDAECPGPRPVKETEKPEEQKPEQKGPEQAPGVDRTAPALSKLALTRKAFTTKGKRKGSSLTFTLSEAASVKLSVAATKPGKRKGKACVKPSKAKKKAKRCTIVGKPMDLPVVKGVAGKNTVAVTGWAKGRRLAKGTYRLTLVATDAAGNRMAAPVSIDFRIT